MEPTQDVGTPDAIWMWTCDTCVVADNEAYLTDSPGVDGGAYDIDWNNRHDTIERNYAHDTQGYCISVFGAGYVTSDSLVRDNLCIDNGLSPRMAVLQGAIFLSTWNGGVIRGLTISGNEIHWNPPVPGTAAIEGPGDNGGTPIVFTRNMIESSSPLIYSIRAPWQSSDNAYVLDGDPVFLIGDKRSLSIEALQSQGAEKLSRTVRATRPKLAEQLHLKASIMLRVDRDGLLSDDALSQFIVLRSLAGQYSPQSLAVIVHLPKGTPTTAEMNALRDLNGIYPDVLHFERDTEGSSSASSSIAIRLETLDSRAVRSWNSPQNAATLGGAVRKLLGPPGYSHMQPLEHHEGQP
jgi:hypothetical protein